MPAAVNPSVTNTAVTTPSRSPSQPQTSLPAAPPVKIKVSAMPIVGRSAPFIFNRNGRNVRNPIRVALSIIAIESSSGKPCPSGAAGWFAASALSDAPGTAARPVRPRAARIAAAPANAATPSTTVALRHGISIKSPAVAAGNAILPRSPEKL